MTPGVCVRIQGCRAVPGKTPQEAEAAAMAASTNLLRAGAMAFYAFGRSQQVALEWGNKRIHAYHMDDLSRARDDPTYGLSDFVKVDQLLRNVSTQF